MPSWRRVLWLPTIAVALGMFLALLAIFHLPAFAQGSPCADDIAKFCEGVKGGRRQVLQCLKAHQTELSSACQARVQTRETRMKEMNDACHDDVQKFCKNISLGTGRLMRCLKQHEAELSSACQDEFAQAWSMRRSNR